MLVLIRIAGKVGVRKGIEATLERLRLRKKYSCVVLGKKPEIAGMIKKVKQFISYGEIDEATLKLLVEKRARKIGDKEIKKEEVEKVVEEIKKGEISTIKPFFRLHPPQGGFKKSTKQIYPKGVLGENKEINDLLRRML